MNARLMFIGSDRIADCILTLRFDHTLDPQPDHTYMFYGPIETSPKIELEKNGVDTSHMTFIYDGELWDHFRSEMGDRDWFAYTGWVAQQFIKLAAMDYVKADNYLIQDCDTFAVKSYKWLDGNQTCMLYLPDETQEEQFHELTTVLAGIPRLYNDSYITELMPMTSDEWNSLAATIEERFNKHWLPAMWDVFAKTPFVSQLWFSEYELLGSWKVWVNEYQPTLEQKRFELRPNFLDRISQLPEYNFVCNYSAVPLKQVDDVERKIREVCQL